MSVTRRPQTAKETPEATPAALAMRYAEMRKTRSGTAIARAEGRSIGYVNNLIRIKRDLCDELWELFEKGVLTADDAKLYASMKRVDQIAAHRAGRARAELRHVLTSTIRNMREDIERLDDRSDQWKEGARDVVDLLLGERRIQGLRVRRQK